MTVAILIFSIGAYFLGLVLIALLAYPHLLGQTFPTAFVKVSMLFLYPLGAGAIKALVNVMGAQQFHPILHKDPIMSYYVTFYTFINIGPLVGRMVTPAVLDVNPFTAYMIPVVEFGLAISIFILGSRRYNKMKPTGKDNLTVPKITGSAICGMTGLEKQKESNGGHYPDFLVTSIKQLTNIMPMTALIIPFNIAYTQMTGPFQDQGDVMASVGGFIDDAWMTNFHSFSCIFY